MGAEGETKASQRRADELRVKENFVSFPKEIVDDGPQVTVDLQDSVRLDPASSLFVSSVSILPDVDSQNTERRLKNAFEELENLMKDIQEFQGNQKVLEVSLETKGMIDASMMEV